MPITQKSLSPQQERLWHCQFKQFGRLEIDGGPLIEAPGARPVMLTSSTRGAQLAAEYTVFGGVIRACQLDAVTPATAPSRS